MKIKLSWEIKGENGQSKAEPGKAEALLNPLLITINVLLLILLFFSTVFQTLMKASKLLIPTKINKPGTAQVGAINKKCFVPITDLPIQATRKKNEKPRQPKLTAIVKHNDHAMTWYDHGDSYSPWYDHGKIMVWSSWN